AGVTVKVIGTTIATSTNAAGQFEIKASPNQSLEFIYLGHTTQVIPITSGTTNLQIRMVEDDNSLEEVVVTGYGSQRRRDLTGSVSVVDVDQLKSTPAASAVESLQGRA